MKTIEQAAEEYAGITEDKYHNKSLCHSPYNMADAFEAGAKLVQRWIPVEEIITEDYMGFINFKVKDLVMCKRVHSQIEFINLTEAYGFTHWRPIELK